MYLDACIGSDNSGCQWWENYCQLLSDDSSVFDDYVSIASFLHDTCVRHSNIILHLLPVFFRLNHPSSELSGWLQWCIGCLLRWPRLDQKCSDQNLNYDKCWKEYNGCWDSCVPTTDFDVDIDGAIVDEAWRVGDTLKWSVDMWVRWIKCCRL